MRVVEEAGLRGSRRVVSRVKSVVEGGVSEVVEEVVTEEVSGPDPRWAVWWLERVAPERWAGRVGVDVEVDVSGRAAVLVESLRAFAAAAGAPAAVGAGAGGAGDALEVVEVVEVEGVDDEPCAPGPQ